MNGEPISRTGQGRLLIVDDNAAQLQALVDSLSDSGYETTAVATPGAALEALRLAPFDLLLTDLAMPEMDGVALAREANKIDDHLVAIVMTGKGTIASAVAAMKAGVYDYILKPFKIADLQPVLTRALSLRQLRIVNDALEKQLVQRTAQLEAKNSELKILQKAASRLNRRIFETSQDIMAITDAFGRFVQVSPSITAVLGYQPEEVVGHLGQEFVHPDDLAATRAQMRAARRGTASRHFRSRYVHKDGHLVPLSWMAIWSEQDRQHFFVGRDMTEWERSEAQLRQAQKMEAVGELTGGVAHDFNNILMIIMANIDELEEGENLDPELLARVKKIEQATQRAANLTRQLLAFSRKQPLRPQLTDVNELVVATCELLRRTLGEHIEILPVLAESLGTVNIDRAQLESALVNLSLNARDAMPAGGRLIIETDNVSLDAAYASRTSESAVGDFVRISVTDTGCGIHPDMVDKVFAPFFTTKGAGKGTGLGLSMVYGFVRQSGGYIHLYSEVDHGTTFKLYLPRHDGTPAVATAGAAAPVTGGTERVLVVEDDPRVRSSVVRQLQSLGYAVSQATDGSAAVLSFETAAEPYDLLLTDVVMPGPLNGKALADEVRRRWPETRIVFMSGYTENAVIHQGRLDEGVLLLTKPFRKLDLSRMVRRALDDQPSSQGRATV